MSETVDLVVHPAAHVNHILPYRQLFPQRHGYRGSDQTGNHRQLKPIHYISTMGVSAVAHQLVDEDSDIRRSVPCCIVDDGYANGYGISKWAGEVLMREAHDLCGVPVAVFRPGMILADSRYAGQLNVPDIFTRLLFSLVATGVAPSRSTGPASRHASPLRRPASRFPCRSDRRDRATARQQLRHLQHHQSA